ncbi:class I SAM-dependent methyltransferase, partial [bacterium]|nr:class I SAM-dependent methyltransferase [bacterium]
YMSHDGIRMIGRTIRRPFNRWDAFNRLKKYHSKPRTLDETVDSGMDLGSRGLYKIKSIQKKSEILALSELVKQSNPATILEIGTAQAGTLFIWSQIATEMVITCDILEPAYRKDLYESFPPPASDCKVKILTGDSHTKDFKNLVAKMLEGRKVDFLFIDGDHTEEGVRKDFNDYKGFVRPGGIVAFHDIIEKQLTETNQVYYLWKDLRESFDTKEFIDNPEQCGYGIGVVNLP